MTTSQISLGAPKRPALWSRKACAAKIQSLLQDLDERAMEFGPCSTSEELSDELREVATAHWNKYYESMGNQPMSPELVENDARMYEAWGIALADDNALAPLLEPDTYEEDY